MACNEIAIQVAEADFSRNKRLMPPTVRSENCSLCFIVTCFLVNLGVVGAYGLRAEPNGRRSCVSRNARIAKSFGNVMHADSVW